MEVKLKSIINPIPWSLVSRAVVFLIAWLLLPFWVFFLVSLVLYLIPFFRSASLSLPFALTIILAFFIPQSFWTALFLGIVFFFILGIKDLVFVDRSSAFNLLILVLSFLIWLYSFSWFSFGITAGSVVWFAFCSTVFMLVARQFISYGSELEARKLTVTLGVVGFILWEVSLAALFLPFNPLYSTALVFLFAVFLLECAGDYFKEVINTRRLLAYFSLFFAVLVLILASADFFI